MGSRGSEHRGSGRGGNAPRGATDSGRTSTGLPGFLLLLACVPGCARSTPSEAFPVATATELDDLPASAIAVVRVSLTGEDGGALAAAAASASGDRLACLVPLLPSLQRIAVALVPRGRDLAAALLLDGALDARTVDGCAADLARSFGLRPLPEGTAPPAAPAGKVAAAGGDSGGRHGWLVWVDRDLERTPLGIRGPLGTAFSRLARHPIVVAVLGGEALRTLSGMAATYLPLSSMGEAADRIVTIAYGIEPRPDGSAAVRVEVEMTTAKAAEQLARQVRQVGRIVALDGEDAAWAGLRSMVRDLSARVGGDGRRVDVEGVLTPAGLRGIIQ